MFLPGESQGQGSLVGCRLWGHTEASHIYLLDNSGERRQFYFFTSNLFLLTYNSLVKSQEGFEFFFFSSFNLSFIQQTFFLPILTSKDMREATSIAVVGSEKLLLWLDLTLSESEHRIWRQTVWSDTFRYSPCITEWHGL